MSELAFFGAFNPPTIAHLSLAGFAAERTGAERVIFVPSRAAYIRGDQGKDFAYTDGERLRMLRAAAANRAWMEVCDWEMRQDHQPRTYETLCHFREEGRRPGLLMGSDKLAELETGWLHVEEIAKEFGVVCLTRGEDECREMIQNSDFLRKLAPWIRVLETPAETRNISSTAVRREVAKLREAEEKIRAMIPGEIYEMLTAPREG